MAKLVKKDYTDLNLLRGNLRAIAEAAKVKQAACFHAVLPLNTFITSVLNLAQECRCA